MCHFNYEPNYSQARVSKAGSCVQLQGSFSWDFPEGHFHRAWEFFLFFFLRLTIETLRADEITWICCVFLTVLMFFVRPSLQSYRFALWEKWFLPCWGMSYVTGVIGQSKELFCFFFLQENKGGRKSALCRSNRSVSCRSLSQVIRS